MTIYDISQKSGVSTATVSRVINGSNAVSKRTREKVLKVIADCGYTPNIFARGLGLNTMRVVGILCADISDPFMSQAISFLEKEIREQGYDVLLSCTGMEMKNRRKGLDLLLSKNVDGVIFVGSNYVEAERSENAYILEAADKAPMMILNGRLDGDNVYCVYCDDKAATMSATVWLLESGRRRVAYMFQSHSYSSLKKLEGYRQAYLNAGLSVDETLIIECGEEASIPDMMEGLSQAAAQGVVFDSVVTAVDGMAVAALKYAHSAGLEVPGDLEIIGFNNSPLCACTEPEITSVDNKLYSLCHTCVSTLMRVIVGEEQPKHSVFSSELILRGSTSRGKVIDG